MPAGTRKFPLDRRSTVLLAIFPPVALGLLNDLYLLPLYECAPALYWAADAFQYLVVPVIVYIFLVRIARISPAEFGFRKFSRDTRLIDSVGEVVFVTVMFWVSYTPVSRIAYRFLWKYAPAFSVGGLIPHGGTGRLLAVTYLSLTAAFVEETVFRGLPWLYFSLAVPRSSRASWYVLTTSVLFAATHSEQGPAGVVAAFSLGLIAAMLYTRIQNLWPFVIGHFVTDMLAFGA